MSRIVKWFLASCTVLLYNVINAQNLDMLTVSKEINSLNNDEIALKNNTFQRKITSSKHFIIKICYL